MSTSQPEPETVKTVTIQTSLRTLELTSQEHQFLLLTYQAGNRQITSLVASRPANQASETKHAKKSRKPKELVA